MSYYIVKVYGLVCDVCEASEEHTPPLARERHPLAETRRELSRQGWRFVAGRDICPKHPAGTGEGENRG